MNRIELPFAVRLTAASFAVFLTMTMLDGMAELAGPGQPLLQAQSGERVGAAAAAEMPHRVAVAQLSASPR
jgi:hypothetical protein